MKGTPAVLGQKVQVIGLLRFVCHPDDQLGLWPHVRKRGERQQQCGQTQKHRRAEGSVHEKTSFFEKSGGAERQSGGGSGQELPSKRPRACFQQSTRRQAALTVYSFSVPSSTAARTLGICVR